MSVARRHHLLPQFYMRAFANTGGQVRVIERSTGHEFTAKTTNVFVERDFYMVSSVDADDDPALIEGLYSQVETIAAPIFARVLAGEFPLGGQDRSELATFMALQVTRGRQFREFMDRTTETLGRAMLQGAAQAPPSYWQRQRAEWEANPEGPEPPEPLTEEQRARWLAGDFGVTFTPSREHVVEMSFVAYEEMTFVLMAMTWHLVRFDRPCLFSSEHPVTYWRRSVQGAQMMGIGPATADEVRFPVGPALALVLTPPDPGARPFDRSPREGIYRGDSQAARRMNHGTLTFPGADRLLLCPDTPHDLPVTPGDLGGGVVSFRPPLESDDDR